jgi:hypothetical protein
MLDSKPEGLDATPSVGDGGVYVIARTWKPVARRANPCEAVIRHVNNEVQQRPELLISHASPSRTARAY